MQDNLNLLPQNLHVSKGMESVLKTTKALGVILIVIFVIFTIGAGAYFVYSKVTLGNLQTNVDQLKSQVKAQESSEQQLVLLKDRLSKISSLRSTPSAGKNVANLDTLFSNVSPASSANQIDISTQKIDITMIVRSNEDLTAFIQNLKNNKAFKSVNLASLGYTKNIGYSIIVSLVNN